MIFFQACVETMKFWKILSNLIEQTLPDWQDKFLSYKDLKKQLKLICPNNNDNKDKDSDFPSTKRPKLEDDVDVTKEVNEFLKLLELEIDKFNSFFVEKEEEYVIKLKVIYFFFNLLDKPCLNMITNIEGIEFCIFIFVRFFFGLKLCFMARL